MNELNHTPVWQSITFNQIPYRPGIAHQLGVYRHKLTIAYHTSLKTGLSSGYKKYTRYRHSFMFHLNRVGEII